MDEKYCVNSAPTTMQLKSENGSDLSSLPFQKTRVGYGTQVRAMRNSGEIGGVTYKVSGSKKGAAGKRGKSCLPTLGNSMEDARHRNTEVQIRALSRQCPVNAQNKQLRWC